MKDTKKLDKKKILIITSAIAAILLVMTLSLVFILRDKKDGDTAQTAERTWADKLTTEAAGKKSEALPAVRRMRRQRRIKRHQASPLSRQMQARAIKIQSHHPRIRPQQKLARRKQALEPQQKQERRVRQSDQPQKLQPRELQRGLRQKLQPRELQRGQRQKLRLRELQRGLPSVSTTGWLRPRLRRCL